MSHSELATSYAALILADDDVEITVGNSQPSPSLVANALRPRSFRP